MIQELPIDVKVLNADRINGMMHIHHLVWLAHQAKSHHRIVEIGSWRGRSTRALCENTPGKVTAVDTWMGSPGLEGEIEYLRVQTRDPDFIFHEFQRNLESCSNLEVVRSHSLHAAKGFLEQGRSFDMVFIDGLHDYASVRADIQAWWKVLDKGGLLCGHDFNFPEVKQAVINTLIGFPADGVGDIWAAIK